jgi:hypothetical protein
MEATAEKQTKPDKAEEETRELQLQAANFMILTDEDFTRADELLVTIANQKKEISASWDSVIAKAHDTHKDAIAKKKKLMDPRLAAETIIRSRMVEYRAAKQIEADKAAAAAAVTSKATLEEDRIFIAHELEKSGRGQEAEAVLSQPIVAPPPTASWSPVPASRGTSFKESWKMRVVNLPALVKAVAEGKAPENLILANETALNGLAKALKASAQVPGVEFYKETGTSVRASK